MSSPTDGSTCAMIASMHGRPLLFLSFALFLGCSELASTGASTSSGEGGAGATSAKGGAGAAGGLGAGAAGGLGAGPAGGQGSAGGAGGRERGTVEFVAVYEAGSAWINNMAAQAMVSGVFADFEATLQTGGAWDSTVEVFLTDDNSGFANTSFDNTFETAVVDAQDVLVVNVWQKVVEGAPDPNGQMGADGAGADFTVHFNVATQSDNAGLLRHEIMHGLGAVGAIPWFTITDTDVLDGIMPTERYALALYDLRLVDLVGQPLFSNYNAADGTFEVQGYVIETTLALWMDGDGGVFFRGDLAAGGTTDMPLSTGPGNNGGGVIRFNEITEVMSAAAHPTWDTIEDPDRTFLRSMGYSVRPR